MNILIPVFPGVVHASALGMADILRLSSSFYQRVPEPKAPWFEPILVSTGLDLEVQNHGTTIRCDHTLATAPKADVVIVPAVVGHLPSILTHQQALVDWMQKENQSGTRLYSTCTGAFFIAATGILDDKEATTSWFAAEEFKALFPQVLLRDERILIDNGTSVTTGATLSFQNLCIYLIEKYYGKALGNLAAKLFLVEKDKQIQSSFAMFHGQKQHGDEVISQIQTYIETHAAERLSIVELAEVASLSERTFIRRFKNATGNTPLEYVQRIKVELAKQWLEEGELSIKEIGFEAGYDDITYFRSIFKKYTGLTPAEYRKQFVFEV